ncbi:9655_t:CDS:2 [Entrophospora sp. SA101]|nr:9655_t:CDS:2 [Entrophospora sp. SA101]
MGPRNDNLILAIIRSSPNLKHFDISGNNIAIKQLNLNIHIDNFDKEDEPPPLIRGLIQHDDLNPPDHFITEFNNYLRQVGTPILPHFHNRGINDINLLSDFLKTYQLGSYWVYPIKDINSNDMENVIKILDQGCAKIVIPGSLILSSPTSLPEKIFDIPSERLAINLNLYDLSGQNSKVDQLVNKLYSLVSGYIITILEQDLSEKLKNSYPENLFKTLENFIDLNQKNILSSGGLAKISVNLLKKDFNYSLDLIKKFSDKNLAPVVPIEKLTLESNHDNSTINLADSFSCTLKSDRPDNLFTTVVVNESDEALGVVYSSIESIREAIKTRTGVYQSRKRGLWYKGSTSGAIQELRKILIDCDNDSLKFVVKQFGSGFCHLNTQTCFGSSNGLSQLEQTLLSRKASVPPGSYTQKLFQNPDLLKSKIMEEADELCAATSKEEIIWEAADLIYFTLAKCVANGVSLSDIESHLDKRAKKISRRPGDVKPKWDVSKKQEKETSNSEVDQKSNSINQEMISMQNFTLSEIDATKRLSLLQ